MIALLPLLLAACAGAPATPASPPVDAAALGANHWQLASARDAGGAPIGALTVRPGKPLTVDFAQGRVAVSNACNLISGGYTLAPGKLQVGPLVSTQMACTDPQVAALDRAIGDRLQGTLQLVLESPQRLRLTTAAGDVLDFDGAPTAQTRYGGPGDTVFLEIAAQTKPCPHPLIPDAQCLQVRELHYDARGIRQGTPGAFSHFYDAIEGYAHQPGVRNVLRVKRFTIANPPADGSSHAWVHEMTVESERVAD